MKKISKFMKNYGFYFAIGIICIGALAAIFLMPNKEGNVEKNANPYAQNKTADGDSLQESNDKGVIIVDEDDLDTTDQTKTQENAAEQTDKVEESQNITDKAQSQNETAQVDNNKPVEEDATPSEEKVTEASPETFDSTTASISEEPFFAEGDTIAWPVEGDVVVPYTDDSTSHWYSESLNQTMRTFGICISAKEEAEVKAVAKGTVVEIIDDSSSYLETGMPYVGKLVVVDIGNGYKAIYGFQGGTVNEKLVGQVVNTGDVLGTIGSPKGAFISVGDNIYLQVTHNDKTINPLNMLIAKSGSDKEDSVDMGFSK